MVRGYRVRGKSEGDRESRGREIERKGIEDGGGSGRESQKR